MERIVLHLGAHKTATTYLQQTLKRNRAALEGAGISVFVPDDLRKDGLRLHNWLGENGGGAEHAAELRAAFSRPARRLVLSEENTLGMVPGPALSKEPKLYPGAAGRLAQFRKLFPDAPVTLLLAVREGAGFLESCHSQALMSGRIAPFAEMFGGCDPAALSWSDLAARIIAAWPGARLTVWDHADWPAVAGQVVPVLLGDDAPPLQWRQGLSHPGLSVPAVDALLASAPADEAQARDLARRLRATFSKEAGHAPHAPVSPADRTRAAAALARDKAELARMPGVTLIRPGPG